MNKPLRTTLLYALIVSHMTGCAGIVLAGAAGGAMLVTDRRNSDMVLDDKQIEVRLADLFESKFQQAHLNASSYNRVVLLTGEVPSQAVGKAVEQAVLKTSEVKSVINELGVGANSSFGSRSSDTFITSKVKTALLEDKLTPSNAFKVTTERGVVFLQGRVSQQEGNRAAEIARTVNGVSRVVKVFDYLSEEELKRVGR